MTGNAKNNKKIKVSISLPLFMISIIGTAIVTTFLTLFIGLRLLTYTNLFTSNKTDTSVSKITELYNEIVNNYVGDIDPSKLVDGALKGMTDALDDPYSQYLNSQETKELNTSLSGEFEGIGASVSKENDLPVISDTPIKDSPAEKSGLKANDVILKVNGEDTTGKTISNVVSKIRGKKGTDVTLTIQRGEDQFEVTITRDTIPVDTVYSKLDQTDPTIGVIYIRNFGDNTFKETQNAITDLREKGATSFVMDLRQNPGGLLDSVQKISSMFLKDGDTIVQFEDKAGKKSTTKAGKELDGGFKVKEPVVVLVDKGSASASEIFAAALKESGKKEVIGTTTFGKGTVQSILPLSSDSEVKLTISKWLTPNGEWIHKKGLVPSIEADYPSYAYLTPVDTSNVYKEGMKDASVKTIKEMLVASGYSLSNLDENFDSELTSTIAQFQHDSQLEETSIADAPTITILQGKVRQLIKENDHAYQKAVEELTKK